LRAAWDDLKLGFRHGSEFEKIALACSSRWQHVLTKVAGWFTHADIADLRDEASALAWLNGVC